MDSRQPRTQKLLKSKRSCYRFNSLSSVCAHHRAYATTPSLTLFWNNPEQVSACLSANGFTLACSTWHSKADSAGAAATPPVAEAAVSSTALSNAANSVSGYTAGTLGALMHDCVKWVFTGQQALKQAQEWQTVLELAQPKRQDAHDAPSCPFLKFITTEASQRGVIAPTSTKITRQHDIVSFCQATACRQILWSDGPWTGRDDDDCFYYHSWRNNVVIAFGTLSSFLT